MLRVTVLLDWDTSRRIVHCRQPSVRHIEQVFDQLQTAVAKEVSSRNHQTMYRVYWRVYHGWHQGKTKTPDRKLFEEYTSTAKSRTINNVSFSTDFSFSGSLCCTPERRPIVDTLRSKDDGSTNQKMVDSMLICDILQLARTRDSSLIILIANDDDFVPALHTAEAWHAKVVMLHNREFINSHLDVGGLLKRMQIQC